jgi:hypothetical protein
MTGTRDNIYVSIYTLSHASCFKGANVLGTLGPLSEVAGIRRMGSLPEARL